MTVLFRKLFHGLPVLSASFPEYENNLLVKSARHFQVTIQLPGKDVNVLLSLYDVARAHVNHCAS